jgi:hypothetical protein
MKLTRFPLLSGALLSALCFLTFSPQPLRAQNWEIGAQGGVSVYNGDLSPVDNLDYFRMLRPMGGVFLRYGPTEWLGFRLGYIATRLHGNADFNTTTVYNRQAVLLRTPLQELALTAELAPVPLRLFGLRFRPFLYGGVAVYRFSPQLRIDGNWIEMQPLGTEGQGLPGQPPRYRTTRVAVPAGGGLRVAVSDRIVLGGELGGRLPFTDYLDDISGRTVSYPFLLEARGPGVAALSNPRATAATDNFRRGNRAGDFYYFGALSLHYRLGTGRRAREVKCYRF